MRTPLPALLVAALGAVLALPACTVADARPDRAAAADAAATTPATPAAPAAPTPTDWSVYELASSWVSQRGDTLRLADLAGPVRVVAMVYTECRATCPLIVADLQRILAAVPADRQADVGVVLVSLDPDRDTPGRLAAWARATRLDPARWTLLSGSDAAVRELAATLDVRYQPQVDGEIAHTNAITVLDARGAVVHRQAGLGEPAAETAAVVASLLH
jgi:protein SCO1/2